MSATCCITFGQRYDREPHPVDSRAHPDGWFEYTGPTYYDAVMGAKKHLTGDDGYGTRVPLYAFDYDEHDIERGYYPRGCLARFRVTTDGVEDVTP